MDKLEKKHIVLTGCAIAALFLLWRDTRNMQDSNVAMQVTSNEPTVNGQFSAPYTAGGNPLVMNNYTTQGGGDIFNSAYNLSVNPSIAHTLTENYIPLFGFVGIAAYNGTPFINPEPLSISVQVNANRQPFIPPSYVQPYVPPYVPPQSAPQYDPNVNDSASFDYQINHSGPSGPQVNYNDDHSNRVYAFMHSINY